MVKQSAFKKQLDPTLYRNPYFKIKILKLF